MQTKETLTFKEWYGRHSELVAAKGHHPEFEVGARISYDRGMTVESAAEAYIKEDELRVAFHGSRGYLSHVEFGCEGPQSDMDGRRVFFSRIDRVLNKDGTINKGVWVRLSHTDQDGLKATLAKSRNKQAGLC